MVKLTDKDCQNIYNAALALELQEHFAELIYIIINIASQGNKLFESDISMRVKAVQIHTREIKRIIAKMDNLDPGYYLVEEDTNVLVEEINDFNNAKVIKFLLKVMRNTKNRYSKEEQDEMLITCNYYKEVVSLLREKLELLNSQGKHYNLPEIPNLGY